MKEKESEESWQKLIAYLMHSTQTVGITRNKYKFTSAYAHTSDSSSSSSSAASVDNDNGQSH